MTLRRLAAVVAALALTVGLIGAGVGASYSDSASAQQNVSIGTFGIEISSTVPGAVVSPDKHSVTFAAPMIVSSAASSVQFPFTVKSTGSVPVGIKISQTAPLAPFTSLLVAPVADELLGQNATHEYMGGLQWPMLVNADLAKVTGITYTATATEGGSTIIAVAPTVTAQSAGLTNGGITIPSVLDLTYFINGTQAAAGFNQRALGTYAVTAVPAAGHLLTGYPAGGWNLTVANAANVRPVTLTGSSVYIASYATGPAPVVNATAQTLTWTIPINSLSTPTYEPIPYFGFVPNPIIGRFIATSPGATVGQTVTATVSPSLTSQAAKFNLIYRSVSAGGERTPFTPNKVLNVAAFAYSTAGHHATDNGVGVMWTGLTAGSTGTVTVVMSFYATTP